MPHLGNTRKRLLLKNSISINTLKTQFLVAIKKSINITMSISVLGT